MNPNNICIDSSEILKVARQQFNYEKLHPGQEEAIASLLEGHDTLTVMPTGAGKSAIYQIATTLLPGPTIVVSPLIALQQDQVNTIREREVGRAAMVNSGLRESERQETLEQLTEGELDFLFLAPEQFTNEETLARLRAAHPGLFVVDEAHCISDWGHDFRPDYLKLNRVVEYLNRPRVLALTATAAPPVRDEIVQRLGLRDHRLVVHGFDRPNIWPGIRRFDDEQAKRLVLLDCVVESIQQEMKPGIVYAATRKATEEIAATLTKRGARTACYHAGLKMNERESVQDAFMADDLDVIVATTAFGMGVDKPNVRFVYHHDISDSVDSYYQEIGRAGRDGQDSKAILFYHAHDLNLRRFQAGGAKVVPEQLQEVIDALNEHEAPIDTKELAEDIDLSEAKLASTLNRLEEVGAVETTSGGKVTLSNDDIDLAEVAQVTAALQEQHQQFQKSRIEMIRGYAETRECLRAYLLNYFGEQFEAPCGFCMNCQNGTAATSQEVEKPFAEGTRVAHEQWAEGVVMRYEGDKIVVLFESVGYKTLGVQLVQEKDLLRPA